MELSGVTEWLDNTWTSALAVARTIDATPRQAVYGIGLARAGMGVVGRFRSGELSRLTRYPENVVIEAIEALTEEGRLEPSSNAGCLLITANVPSYTEPTEPGAVPAGPTGRHR